ncbi:MAG: hypothetical protein RL885_29455 [Planctomycetota bacterium]
MRIWPRVEWTLDLSMSPEEIEQRLRHGLYGDVKHFRGDVRRDGFRLTVSPNHPQRVFRGMYARSAGVLVGFVSETPNGSHLELTWRLHRLVQFFALVYSTLPTALVLVLWVLNRMPLETLLAFLVGIAGMSAFAWLMFLVTFWNDVRKGNYSLGQVLGVAASSPD